jgi:hypothetical protein
MPFPEGSMEPIDDILFPVTDTGIAAKYTLTEENVRNALKERYILDNPALSAPKSTLLAFLAGIGGGGSDGSEALALATNIAIAIHNGWHGSGGTGTAEQVQAVIEDIKDALGL